MHELMHYLADLFFGTPWGGLLFVAFGGILGFAIAKQVRVWSLSGLVTVLTILLIPLSFLVESGHALAPIAYFAIVPAILVPYWLVLAFTRLLSHRA